MNCDDTMKDAIALKGNGKGDNISEEQFQQIKELYKKIKPLREALAEKEKVCTQIDSIGDFCDYETCRRYLVARQWSMKGAEKQLISTLNWRIQNSDPGELLSMEFWQSPKAYENPHALNLRCIGLDKRECPVMYTCYGEAHDRFDTKKVLIHMTLLLESIMRLIKQRRSEGLNQTADSRKWIVLVDFDGYGLRDNNPRLGLALFKLLMDHYPEMLKTMYLINAPMLFSSVWSMAKPLLDEVVISKINFVKGKERIKQLFYENMGDEITEWVLNEMEDNLIKRQEETTNGFKKYWIAPKDSNEHDPRGVKSYVDSKEYIKTPGDAFEEKKNSND